MSLFNIANNEDPSSLASKLRRKRFAMFCGMLENIPGRVKILDLGGTDKFWRATTLLSDPRFGVTLLNVDFGGNSWSRVEHVQGSACDIPFPDKSFDVVYSNSVIEHVGGQKQQQRMAEEIVRVGERYFVQTPNYFFPIEPHFLFPGFQFLPPTIRARMLHQFNLGWYKREQSISKAREVVDSIELLKRQHFANLFPGAKIYDEKILGMTKSFVAYKGFQS